MERYRYRIAPKAERTLSGRYAHHQSANTVKPDPMVQQVQVHGSYGSLLFDPRWKARRAEIMARDSSCCVICRAKEELQVHHRQYHFVKAANAFKMPWDYANHLLITLCKSCHQRGHSKFKVPTLSI
jgi:5-methylcytosine-specific restriction endonuclease McrA